MEAAPLTLAHTHARNAALETKRNNPVAASEEHDLAATEFATAAQSTHDSEALRILCLLEQHHKKLGQILKSTHGQSVASTQVVPKDDTTGTGRNDTSSQSPRSLSSEYASHPPKLLRTGRPNTRDLSSSIASNLASARGIPSSRPRQSMLLAPQVSAQQADGHITQEQRSSQSGSRISDGRPANLQADSRPSWAPPLDVAVTGTKAAPVKDSTAADAPFQQFYSTFEGLLSKLSAPLAFAGLPLTSTQPTQPKTPDVPKTATVRQKATEALQSSVDYSQMISRAALRAVRSDNASYNPSESFYVVPTSGGTSSYADIMSRVDREDRTFRDHRRNLSNLSDDFVDAPSTMLPPTKAAIRPNEATYQGKTMEEIALENKALKHLSDTLSRRLHVFEMSAQTSSAALAQSIRSLHLSPTSTPENSRGKTKGIRSGLSSPPLVGLSPEQITAQLAKGDANPTTTAATPSIENDRLTTRITTLEDALKRSEQKTRQRAEENAKLRDTIGRYREKWDNLKAGAKARREKEGRDGRDGTKKEKEGNSSSGRTKKDRDKYGREQGGGGGGGGGGGAAADREERTISDEHGRTQRDNNDNDDDDDNEDNDEEAGNGGTGGGG